jgi:LPS O-antigen subunit length determinant protein (WzzB/FepE family)
MEREQHPNYYDEYEIDLREYILLLWKNKFFIGGLVILAVIAAFLVSSYYMAPTYETKAKNTAVKLRRALQQSGYGCPAFKQYWSNAESDAGRGF